MIYLDNHATTPLDPRVLDAMLPFFTGKFGNAASSSHRFGWEAGTAVETARQRVARLIGATPGEIVFTSGATESNNLAIKGAVEGSGAPSPHVITSAIEHKAILDVCRVIGGRGARITILPVSRDGFVDPASVAAAIGPDTVLVSIMYANNEVGTIQPVAEIGHICRSRGVLFHSDGAQAVGKVPIDVAAESIDLLSMSAHKLYGPKGVGALFVRRNPGIKVTAQLDGGGHERGMRSGTLNVPGIVGLGEACALCHADMAAESARIADLRDRLRAKLEAGLPGTAVNGAIDRRLPHNLSISFAGVESDALMMGLPGVAVSSGSACTSAKVEPSHVLKALGLEDARALGSLRFGLGRFTTAEEIDQAAAQVIEAVGKLRELRGDL